MINPGSGEIDTRPKSIRQEGLRPNIGIEIFPSFEEFQFDEKKKADHFAAEALDQLQRRPCCSACREEVIDEDDPLSGQHRIFVNLDMGLAVLERVGDAIGFPWQFPLFPDRDKTHSKPVRHRRAKDETAGVDTDDLVRLFFSDRGNEFIDREAEELPVAKDGCDVFEDDTGFRKVMHVADRGPKLREMFLIHPIRFNRIPPRSRWDHLLCT